MINGEPLLLGGKGETASIFVTGLTETDTVTATKDGKTWNGVWGSKTSTVITPLIPTLTGTSSSVFNTATYSSYTSSFPSWHIFDDNDTSEWIPNLDSSATSGTAYVGYDLGTSKVAKYYRVYNHDGNYYDFKVQASNDNSTWVDLTSYISVSRDTEYYNSLNNTTAYRYYRLYLNKTGSGEYVRPAEFQVYGEEQGAVYGHIINKLNSYGTYTVTATNQAQTKTATESVLVDMATEYDVSMSYLPSGCIAEYLFEDNLNDTSGEGNDGTAVGTTLYIDGKINRATQGRGTATNYINLISAANLNVANRSMSCWFIRGASTGIELSADGPSWKPYGMIYLHGELRVGTITTSTPTDSNWHHIAFTQNGYTIKLFVDGVLVNSGTTSANHVSVDGNTQVYLFANREGNAQWGNGCVDQLRFYNRTLTDAEVLTLYNNGQGA